VGIPFEVSVLIESKSTRRASAVGRWPLPMRPSGTRPRNAVPADL
jgi:hypothetical protein